MLGPNGVGCRHLSLFDGSGARRRPEPRRVHLRLIAVRSIRVALALVLGASVGLALALLLLPRPSKMYGVCYDGVTGARCVRHVVTGSPGAVLVAACAGLGAAGATGATLLLTRRARP